MISKDANFLPIQVKMKWEIQGNKKYRDCSQSADGQLAAKAEPIDLMTSMTVSKSPPWQCLASPMQGDSRSKLHSFLLSQLAPTKHTQQPSAPFKSNELSCVRCNAVPTRKATRSKRYTVLSPNACSNTTSSSSRIVTLNYSYGNGINALNDRNKCRFPKPQNGPSDRLAAFGSTEKAHSSTATPFRLGFCVWLRLDGKRKWGILKPLWGKYMSIRHLGLRSPSSQV